MTAVLTPDYAPDAEILEHLDPFERRDEWLEARRQVIGASDIAGVLSISPWASPFTVWADKVGLLPDREPNRRMKAGNYFEDGVRRWFADETGLHVIGQGASLRNRQRPLMGCTADGAIPAERAGLEIKYEGPSAAWDEIPDKYQAQAQWQMATAGWERVYFAVSHGGYMEEGGGLRLERDDDDIALMVERAEEFWALYVVTGTPPPVDGSDATEAALKTIYPDHVPGAHVDVGHVAHLVVEWDDAREQRIKWERAEKEARNQLVAELRDAELGVVAGIPILSCRRSVRRGLDTKALAEAYPDVAAEFATETPYRVLRHASKTDMKEFSRDRS